MKYRTNHQEETIKLGKLIGERLQPGMCITLAGDLGTGKTTFTKGIAQGLDIVKVVNSPTFTILKIYQGKLPLYHIDAYRLEGIQQDLGFEEYIEGDGICVIEWSQFIEELLPTQRLAIQIERVNENERIFYLEAVGSKYETLIGELQ